MKDVDDLMKESEKMMNFKHPNVLSLIGVCIEAGDTPYIVLPYMANGSLLVYLRKERPHLTIVEGAGSEMVRQEI
jgi:serine/threonine protein kinase